MNIVHLLGVAVLCVVAGCQDNRVPALEQRIKQLEERTRQLEADRQKASDDDAAKRAKLESCVADANSEFQLSIARNGTKQPNGTYNVPVPLAEQMQRQKQAKIDECRLLYGK